MTARNAALGKTGLQRSGVIFSALAIAGTPAFAQEQAGDTPVPADTPAASRSGEDADIVVVGTRGSALTGIEPLATLDSRAIEAIGATSIGELLRTIRGTTQSADGSEPIFLLNAQRVSGYGEIGSLPPEAIEKVEVLPEPAALRFGFPPTRRVVNFITKRRFRQLEVKHAIGTTTRGGGATVNPRVGLTRFREDARLTLQADYKHTDALFQSERDVLPDPDILFDAVGNVTGIGGAEIDPALSAGAGAVVTVAPVPNAAGDRTLAAFAAGANRPRLCDLGPYRTLRPANDTGKIEAVIADRIGGTLAGSINLSAEQSRDRSIAGPAFATLRVPAGAPASPFGTDVLLQRYLTEADPLRLRQTVTTLHAGLTLRGAVGGWRWDLTAAFDQQRTAGSSDRAIDLTAANAAIESGTDPFSPLAPGLLGARLVDRAALRTRTTGAKVVTTNTPFRMPAGKVSVIATAEAERVSANSYTIGPNPFALALGRDRVEGGLALDIPLASRREGFLPWAGEVSVNAAATLREVAGFGTLWDTTAGASWAPLAGIQLLAQWKRSAAAPPLDQQSAPVVRIPNATVFDYRTGRSALVTLIQGGNPDLLAERREVSSLTLNVKPFASREWRVSATWSDTIIRDQTATIYALNDATESLLPDLFVRDAAGRLVSVAFRPINIARERQQSLTFTLNTSGMLGNAPPPAGGGKPTRPRGSYWGGLGPTLRLQDRLLLRQGTPELDVLGGDTISGAGTSRLSGYGYAGLSYMGNGISGDFWYGGPNRVRSTVPEADLSFSTIFKLNLAGFVSVHHFLPKQDWTRKLQLRIDVNNVTDARQRIVDATGLVPNRFQLDYTDPVGRTVTLSLRKLL